jgi:hypothetical protein
MDAEPGQHQCIIEEKRQEKVNKKLPENGRRARRRNKGAGPWLGTNENNQLIGEERV